jgi:C-terminal processing protease CtpA/Prc
MAALGLSRLPAYPDNPAASLIQELGSADFKVRVAAKRELVELYDTDPSIIDPLCKLVLDQHSDLESVLNAREVLEEIVCEKIFVERGSIGIMIGANHKVLRLVPQAPASISGIKIGWALVEIDGKAVQNLGPGDIYSIIHQTRPGDKLPMTFTNELGDNVLVEPVVAPRSKVRPDENVEQRKSQFFEDWLNTQKARNR